MLYKLQLNVAAKNDTRVYRGVEVNKTYPVYVETDKDLGSAAKAKVDVTPIERLPERDHANNYPQLHRI